MVAELRHLWCDHHLTIGLRPVQPEILLMIVLRLVERLERHNLRYNWLLPDFGGVRFLDNFLRHRLLFGVVIEYCGSVLGSDIPPLAVKRGRIMRGEEDLQDIFEGDLFGIEGYLDRLGMSGCSCAHVLVGWVWDLAAGIA